MRKSIPAHKQTDPAKKPGQIVNPVKSNVSPKPVALVVPTTHAVASATLLARTSLPFGHEMMDDMLNYAETTR